MNKAGGESFRMRETEDLSGKLRIIICVNGMEWSGGLAQITMLTRELCLSGHKVLIIHQPGSVLRERAKHTGALFESVPMRQEYDLFSIRKLGRIIDAFRPHIVDVQRGKAHTLVLSALLKRKKPAMVLTRRVAYPVKGNPLSWMKFNSLRIDAFIAVSSGVAKILKKCGLNTDRIFIARDAADVKRLQEAKSLSRDKARKELGLNPEHIAVGCFANVAPCKGHDDLLRAWSLIESKTDKGMLILAGRGTDSDEMMKKQELYKLKRVKLLGWRDDVPSLLRALDIFTLPSREEAMGTALIEAGCMGLPLVGTLTGGIPEVVQHGENGFLAEPGDENSIAACIYSLISDADFRAEMGKTAESRLMKRVKPERVTKRVLNIYRTAIQIRKQKNAKY